MTVSTTGTVAESLCNGVTTSFPVPFQYAAPTDLVVELIDAAGTVTVLSEGAHYFRSGDGMSAPTGITTTVAYGSGNRLRRRRDTGLTQDLDLVPNVGAPAEAQERALDRAVLALQERRAAGDDIARRAIAVPEGEVARTLPGAAARRDTVLVFDEVTGQPGVRRTGSFPPGPPGGAGNVAMSLAQLQAAPRSNGVMIAGYDGSGSPMTWTEGNFAAQAGKRPFDFIESDFVPLTVGAWVRLRAAGVLTAEGVSVQEALDAKRAGVLAIAEGLTVKVLPFELLAADGTVIAYPGGIVPVFASGLFHLGYDLFDGVIRPLRYRMHSGCVWLGSITTNANGVTAIVQEPYLALPPCRIPVFQARRTRANVVARIVGLGTSLMEGAGSGVIWHQLLFDPTYQDRGFLIRGGRPVKFTNAAMGGSSAHHSFMQMGESIAATGGGFGGTEITLGPVYQALNGVPAVATRQSPWLDYDLLLIGPQANGGTNNFAYMEATIRRARRAGMEVVIFTENNRSDFGAFLTEGFPQLVQLAEAYGCAIVDTWSYMRFREDMGINCHADGIHQNAEGHVAYAQAARSVLNDRVLIAAPQSLPERRFALPQEDSVALGKSASKASVQFTPYFTTGTLEPINTAFYGPDHAPGMAFGGRPLDGSNYMYRLTPGQEARYGHVCAMAMDIILATSETCTLEIRSQDKGSLVKTLVVPGNGTQNNTVIEALPYGEAGDISPGQPGYANRGYQLVCTAGTARVVGVVFHTPEFVEIPFAEMDFVGTWASEPWIYGHNFSRYTDTAGDRVVVPFTGTGALILLGQRPAGGKVDAYLDGQKVYADVDLAANAFIASLTVAPKTEGDFSTGYGPHVATVVLKSVNANAPTPDSRNLTVLGAYALDAR